MFELRAILLRTRLIRKIIRDSLSFSLVTVLLFSPFPLMYFSPTNDSKVALWSSISLISSSHSMESEMCTVTRRFEKFLTKFSIPMQEFILTKTQWM